jgi:hypothetical protein
MTSDELQAYLSLLSPTLGPVAGTIQAGQQGQAKNNAQAAQQGQIMGQQSPYQAALAALTGQAGVPEPGQTPQTQTPSMQQLAGLLNG